MRPEYLRSPTGSDVAVRTFSRLALLALCVSCSSEAPQRSLETTSSPQGIAGSDSLPRPPRNRTPDSQELQPGPGLLTPDGWGPLRIGMTRAEVVAAAGEDARPDAVGGPDPQTCDEFRPREAPVGLLVMIQNGILTRISVSRTSDISTPAGIRVGDSGTAVVSEYGSRALVEAHQYWEAPARYVTVWRESEGDRRGIRYEINADDEVVHIRAGGPSIEYLEGCV